MILRCRRHREPRHGSNHRRGGGSGGLSISGPKPGSFTTLSTSTVRGAGYGGAFAPAAAVDEKSKLAFPGELPMGGGGATLINAGPGATIGKPAPTLNPAPRRTPGTGRKSNREIGKAVTTDAKSLDSSDSDSDSDYDGSRVERNNSIPRKKVGGDGAGSGAGLGLGLGGLSRSTGRPQRPAVNTAAAATAGTSAGGAPTRRRSSSTSSGSPLSLFPKSKTPSPTAAPAPPSVLNNKRLTDVSDAGIATGLQGWLQRPGTVSPFGTLMRSPRVGGVGVGGGPASGKAGPRSSDGWPFTK